MRIAKQHGRASAGATLLLVVVMLLPGCNPPDPNANTSTSGRLIVYVDEIYAPLVQALADTFMVKSPNAKVELRPAPARLAMQAFLNAQVIDSTSPDTNASVVLILGRELLPDERKVITDAGYDSKEYVIGYDGIAIVVPTASPIRQTTLERLRAALSSVDGASLDTASGGGSARFVLPDQNSSTLAVLRRTLLGDSNVSTAVRYYASSDSVLAQVAAGEGIGILGRYRAHLDSLRLRTLPLGFTDSIGRVHPPAIVHPASLVTDAYPLKQPVIGYTFGIQRSLGVGFLAWLSRSDDAQRYLAFNAGLQPTAKLRLVLPASE